MASIDSTVRIYDVRDPVHPVDLSGPIVSSVSYALTVAFRPDSRILAVGSSDKNIYLWDIRDPRAPARIGPPMGGPTNYVYALAFSPDGTTLAATNTDSTLWLWDVSNPEKPTVQATLLAGEQPLYTLAYSPDGTTLAAAGGAKKVWLWETDPERVAKYVCEVTGDPITEEEWNQYIIGLPYDPPCPAL